MLPVEDPGDGGVGVVGGQSAQQVDGVLAGAQPLRWFPLERHGQFGDRATLPTQDEVGGSQPGSPKRSTPTDDDKPQPGNPEVSTLTSVDEAQRGTKEVRAPITRRKLDEIFGDVLPSTTRDERDEGRDPSSRDNDERWYRDNRPPHHG